jgi:N-acetylglucosamine-6-phosphate deacetylase
MTSITLERALPRRLALPFARPELVALLALGGLLNLWGLERNGYANEYYSAAVQAMSTSWRAFAFGSFDAAGVMTIDKPPLALWVQALSVRAFGMHPLSMLLPQALMGVAALWLTYDLVRRRCGRAAGFAAGLVLALTPISVAIARHNNPDALLVLCCVAALWFTARALEDGRTRWLVLAGVAVGLGFETKMGAALLVVPAIAAAYLWVAPRGSRRALLQSLAGGAALALVGGAWPALMAFVRSGSRPWISGTGDDSIVSLILGYNGVGRLAGQAGGPPAGGGPGAVFGGTPGLFRLFGGSLGDQAGWLLGLSLGGAAALLAACRLRRADPRSGWLIAVGGAFATIAVAFSFAGGIFHPYYVSLLAPPAAALVGAGVAQLAAAGRTAQLPARRRADGHAAGRPRGAGGGGAHLHAGRERRRALRLQRRGAGARRRVSAAGSFTPDDLAPRAPDRRPPMRLGVAAALVDGRLLHGDVAVEGDAVVGVGLGGGGGGIAAPGFVDLQVNGFAGIDFMAADATGHAAAAAAMLATGTTSYQPTFITAPERDLIAALGELPRSPCVIGAHLEGPFISPHRLGVHPAEFRRDPDRALLERLLGAAAVTHVTLAPELDGAGELIDLLGARGVVVAAGHSDATAGEARTAFDRGVRTVTHLFNAMRPPVPRDPGIALAALARADVAVQLIADGHHLAADTVLVAWRAARGRLALVTDAVAAAGIGDGEFVLAGRPVVARGGAVHDRDGRLAGSALTMIDAVRNLHALGVPLEEALAAASAVPAAIARRPDLGRLGPGARADVVVLDDTLAITRVLARGVERYTA